MRSVAVQPEATHEIDDVVQWYEEREQGLGLHFLHQLEVVCASIAREPESFPKAGSGFHRALMRKFPYAVFYEFTVDMVIVSSVLNCSRTTFMTKKRSTTSKEKAEPNV